MHKSRRLQRLPWLLNRQLHRRQLTQLGVHQRQQLLRCQCIASFDLRQDASDVGHERINRRSSERPMSRALRYLAEGQLSSFESCHGLKSASQNTFLFRSTYTVLDWTGSRQAFDFSNCHLGNQIAAYP
jgi:hypothetical protein